MFAVERTRTNSELFVFVRTRTQGVRIRNVRGLIEQIFVAEQNRPGQSLSNFSKMTVRSARGKCRSVIGRALKISCSEVFIFIAATEVNDKNAYY
ncbi:ATP-dependent helicase/deoxyribonuclease subunit B [Frankliniella fusca]|uniref:ATP-dependent helicase/deoxyribonuclease subunit B n=1 Tax=Frankliniella fusca TaxID=407009 RepID=A0AAE1LTY3_9NEOP|nr:ATP-dependent helicase/deoxyribonuclease subunit B [Frankliniella fusca]